MKQSIYIALAVIALSAFGYSAGPWGSIPSHVPRPDQELATLDADAIELGRVLFYDAQFSADGLVSCASCHNPYNAFAHTDHATSHGVFDSVGRRNAPALFNLAWQDKFMHDGAAHSLDAQALAPLTSPLEMGAELEEIKTKLTTSELYAGLFERAGYKEPTVAGALDALEAFQLSLISLNSKYDQVLQGDLSFTAQEAQGYEVFKQNCASCHKPPLFSTYDFASNGLPVDSTLLDLGRFEQTGNDKDRLHFKVPSLRNLSYTYPYMHDGRFLSIRNVLDHYSPKKGNMSQSPLEAPLSPNEKTDLLAFLKTLNDPEFVFNPSHQFPHWTLTRKTLRDEN